MERSKVVVAEYSPSLTVTVATQVGASSSSWSSA
jgi:hypothetical protein